jgi:hypothetical protein
MTIPTMSMATYTSEEAKVITGGTLKAAELTPCSDENAPSSGKMVSVGKMLPPPQSGVDTADRSVKAMRTTAVSGSMKN